MTSGYSMTMEDIVRKRREGERCRVVQVILQHTPSTRHQGKELHEVCMSVGWQWLG